MKTLLTPIIALLFLYKAEAHQRDSIRSVSYYMYQYDQDKALTMSYAEPKKRSKICEGWNCIILGVVGGGLITAIVFGSIQRNCENLELFETPCQ